MPTLQTIRGKEVPELVIMGNLRKESRRLLKYNLLARQGTFKFLREGQTPGPGGLLRITAHGKCIQFAFR